MTEMGYSLKEDEADPIPEPQLPQDDVGPDGLPAGLGSMAPLGAVGGGQ